VAGEGEGGGGACGARELGVRGSCRCVPGAAESSPPGNAGRGACDCQGDLRRVPSAGTPADTCRTRRQDGRSSTGRVEPVPRESARRVGRSRGGKAGRPLVQSYRPASAGGGIVGTSAGS